MRGNVAQQSAHLGEFLSVARPTNPITYPWHERYRNFPTRACTDTCQRTVPRARAVHLTSDSLTLMTTETHEEALRRYIQAELPTTVAELARLVRIPSVSWPAYDPAHVSASADAVAELLRGIGLFDLVEVRQAALDDSAAATLKPIAPATSAPSTSSAPPVDSLGAPAVVAPRAARNGRPTVLLYAHHDVQPPGNDTEWETPPFEPTLRGDRLYGRGAADDKAGIMAHIGALRAVRDILGDRLDVGIALFIEGEEEYNSR